jgi:hypothetical protein
MDESARKSATYIVVEERVLRGSERGEEGEEKKK